MDFWNCPPTTIGSLVSPGKSGDEHYIAAQKFSIPTPDVAVEHRISNTSISGERIGTSVNRTIIKEKIPTATCL
tara:strand:+ start:218 stop:439 length:222 start_codon:yes stop_codon:yes gene_type:complete